MVKHYELYLKHCPVCGHDHLIRWGYYKRKGLPLVSMIRVQRVRCKSCGRTSNVLPSFLLAHKSYAVIIVKELLLNIIQHPKDWKQFLREDIDISTAYRWRRRLIMQFTFALPEIRKALCILKPENLIAEHIDKQPHQLSSARTILERFLKLAEQQFEVSSILVGKTVDVRYNHFDLTRVFIYLDGRFIQNAKPTKISRWNTAKKQHQPATVTEKTPRSDVHHLQHLEQQYQQEKIQQAKKLTGQAGTELPQKIQFTKARFFKEVATSLKRKLENFHAKELDEMQAAWDKFGPFEPALVHIALAKAIMDKKTEQHISFYLKYIINTHINHQNK